MKLIAMTGCKLFRVDENNVARLIRITHVNTNSKKEPTSVTIINEDGKTETIKPEKLKGYTPLEPDGILTINAVDIADERGVSSKDVIVTATKYSDAVSGRPFPFAICRQSITNLFYNLAVKDESEMRVGMSLNQLNCPAGFDIGLMIASNNIEKSDFINFYINEKIEDVLCLIPLTKYNMILKDLLSKHAKAANNPNINFKKEDKGWCRDVKTLLDMNGFQNDVNEMLNITDIEFNISEYIEKKPIPNNEEGLEYYAANKEFLEFLSYCTKKNIVDASVIDYDYDIDLEKFQNTDHFLLRDTEDKVYVILMVIEGEYHEDDLLSKEKIQDITTKFRLKFYQTINQNSNWDQIIKD